MTSRHDELELLARQQCGFVSAAQASAIGFGAEAMAALTESARWNRECLGLFRLAGVRQTALDDFAKWCTWYGGTATVSHYSAADLHGLGHLQPRFIHLSVGRPAATPSTQVALHRRRLVAAECEQAGPIRITTPVRTVMDLASGGISQTLLNEVVADAVAIGRIESAELFAACETASSDVSGRIERALG